MGVTSSGLLDEERDAQASTTNETYPAETLDGSGEKNAEMSTLFGYDVAGTPRVNWEGPCYYTLP